VLIVIGLRLLQTEIIINKTNNMIQKLILEILIISLSLSIILLSLLGNIFITIQMIKALKYIKKKNKKK
jgi:hypothetical protein